MNPLNVNLVSAPIERMAQDAKHSILLDGTLAEKNLAVVNPDAKLEAEKQSVASKQDVTRKNDVVSKDDVAGEDLFQDMQQNIAKLNEIFPLTTTNLSFEFDKTGSESFIRVIDRDNQKVIREIPSEEFRKVAKALDEFADNFRTKGLIFDRTA